ncbi:MAG: UDP-N-acetylmuramate dehydrogenase [Gammaproteobacteria bacterium TMED112]|nr:MAG: UDP-N-acetylmuramate dehydrogenase [Gammaproteobacteria bacterium TMED112]|tara:strand:- start:5674 stop:6645 length:972 start_codon:yes stop_codon:yes gene_type:complete
MMDLTKDNNLNLKSEASEFFLFESEDDLLKLFDHAESNGKNIQVIGSGTNTIFPRYFSSIVIKSTNNNFTLSKEDGVTKLEVGAAVTWDDLIDFCCSKNLYGLENLAGIPGTVGAAPVQNIGAYGVEISNLIDYVECFDSELKIIKKIKNECCDFAYRKSIFQANTNLIVTAVGLKLQKEFNPVLDHESIQNKLFSNADEMIEEIRKVRNSKIPDPSDFPNLGSFFKNPIITKKETEKNQRLTALKQYEMPNEMVKLSAGEMLDKLSLKGMKIRNVGLSTKHALVLTSNGITAAKDIKYVEDILKTLVQHHYGVELEREPIYL